MIRKRMKFSKGAEVTSRHMWYLDQTSIHRDAASFDSFTSSQVYSRKENCLQEILTVFKKYLIGDKERDFVEK